LDTIGDRELEARLREAYDLVFSKLTKRDQASIASGRTARKARTAKLKN
jgi:hypothetical protein